MNYTNLSKFIALVLRHKPKTIGITIDEHGWADVNELIDGINNSGKFTIDMSVLEEIVRTDSKQRYKFNDDKTKIRASQGHSINVDLELEPAIPPDILYHGTGERFVNSINAQGINSQGRQYVHLSKDYETAVNVGKRHGKPFVYKVLSGEMQKQGYKFFLSENGVWLTDFVPVNFLREC